MSKKIHLYFFVSFFCLAIIYQNCDSKLGSFEAQIASETDMSSLAKIEEPIGEEQAETTVYSAPVPTYCDNRDAITNVEALRIDTLSPSLVQEASSQFQLYDLKLRFSDFGVLDGRHQYQCEIGALHSAPENIYYGFSAAAEKCLQLYQHAGDFEKSLIIRIDKNLNFYLSKNVQIKNLKNISIISTDKNFNEYNFNLDSPVAYDLSLKNEIGIPLVPTDLRPVMTRCRTANIVDDRLVISDKADEAIFEISGSQNIKIAGLKFNLNTVITGKGTHGISFNQSPSTDIQIVNNYFYDELRADQAQRNGDAYAIHLNHKPGQMRDLNIAFNQTYGLLQLTGGGGEGIVNGKIYGNVIYRAKYNGIALTTLDVKNIFENIEIYNNEIISPKSLGIYIGPDKIWKMEKVSGRNSYRPVYASAYGRLNKIKIYKNKIINLITGQEDLIYSKLVAAEIRERPADWMTKTYAKSSDVWKYYSRSSFSGIFIRANSENNNLIVKENKIYCSVSRKIDSLVSVAGAASPVAVSNWVLQNLLGANAVEIVSNQKGIEIGNDFSRLKGDVGADGIGYFADDKYKSTNFAIAQAEFSQIKTYYNSMDYNKLAKFKNVLISDNDIQNCREKIYLDSVESGTLRSVADSNNFSNINYGTSFRYFKLPELGLRTPTVEYEFLNLLPANSAPTFYDVAPTGVSSAVEICPLSEGCNVRQLVGAKGQDAWRESGEVKDSATKSAHPLVFSSSSSRPIKRNGNGSVLNSAFIDW